MRLFIALDIDPAIAQRLDEYVRALKPRVPGVKFVRDSNYHVTLKFLGEVRDAEAVRERLRQVRGTAFEIDVRGTGFFPNARVPRVFWAGIEWAGIEPAGAESSPLAGLAGGIEEAMAELGFARERGFHPHLTLARNGSGRPRPVRGEHPPEAFAQLAALVASAPAPQFGTMTAREFFLYESRLLPSGAEYRKLERFALAAGAPAMDVR